MKLISSFLVLFVAISASFSAFGEEASHSQAAEKGGANLNLFPPKPADLSRSGRPETPKLIAPAYMEKLVGGSVNLKWEAVTGADTYHLQIATDPNFKWLVYDNWEYKNTSYELKTLEQGKNYFWRVAAMKLNNQVGHTKGWFAASAMTTK